MRLTRIETTEAARLIAPAQVLRAVLEATGFALDEAGALWYNDAVVHQGKWWTRWRGSMDLPAKGSVHESEIRFAEAA